MNPVWYSLFSALLWALSALVVSRGLALLPAQRVAAVVLGLSLAQVTGSALLCLFFRPALGASDFSLPVVLAGLLTFPLATGLYYITAIAVKGRAEVAAQFSQVKPVLSVLLGALLLNEALHALVWLSLGLVALGLGLLILERKHGAVTLPSLLLGLLLALLWAGGEVAVALAPDNGRGVEQTTAALLVGTGFSALVAIPLLIRTGWPPLGSWLLYFLAHGALSFALAYLFYFASIRALGVGPTALINAFWPVLSLIAAQLVFRSAYRSVPLSSRFWLSALLLLAGSLSALLASAG